MPGTEGMSNEEIAERIVLQPASVRCNVSRILAQRHLRDQGVGKVGSGSWLGDELDGAFGASGQGSGG